MKGFLRKIVNKRNVVVALSLAFMIYFIMASDELLPSVRDGLNLYVTAVLPSMLPFLFFSKLLTELDFASSAGKVFQKPLARLFRAPPVGAYILLMSLLCGYPVGAKLVGECFSQGILDENEAKRLCAFTSASGPLFIVGTVGVTMFGSKTTGFLLLGCHYLGTFLNGLVFRGKKRDETGRVPCVLRSDDPLGKSMLNTVVSVGLVGGFITLFNLLSDAAVVSGLTPFLCKTLSKIGLNERLSAGLVGGLFEMTKGCLLLSKSGFSPLVTLPLCEFLISFGGGCVTTQSLAFLSKTKISPAYYLLVKGTQGILCSGICLLVVYLLSYAG